MDWLTGAAPNHFARMQTTSSTLRMLTKVAACSFRFSVGPRFKIVYTEGRPVTQGAYEQKQHKTIALHMELLVHFMNYWCTSTISNYKIARATVAQLPDLDRLFRRLARCTNVEKVAF